MLHLFASSSASTLFCFNCHLRFLLMKSSTWFFEVCQMQLNFFILQCSFTNAYIFWTEKPFLVKLNSNDSKQLSWKIIAVQFKQLSSKLLVLCESKVYTLCRVCTSMCVFLAKSQTQSVARHNLHCCYATNITLWTTFWNWFDLILCWIQELQRGLLHMSPFVIYNYMYFALFAILKRRTEIHFFFIWSNRLYWFYIYFPEDL